MDPLPLYTPALSIICEVVKFTPFISVAVVSYSIGAGTVISTAKENLRDNTFITRQLMMRH